MKTVSSAVSFIQRRHIFCIEDEGWEEGVRGYSILRSVKVRSRR